MAPELGDAVSATATPESSKVSSLTATGGEHNIPKAASKGGSTSPHSGKASSLTSNDGTPGRGDSPGSEMNSHFQRLLLDTYIQKDNINAVEQIDQREAQNELLQAKRREAELYRSLGRERAHNPGAIFGRGYMGYGNGRTDGETHVVYPSQRKRAGDRRTRRFHATRSQMATLADQIEELVPIRLDIDWEKIKLRDTFTWNLHDRVISPELFAEQLVEDFKLPPNAAPVIGQLVYQSVAEQIQDFYPPVYFDEEALDPHLPYHAYKNDEMRVLIKINITIGQNTLVDQFEWDMNNPHNSPEEFATQMTKDLALSGEFTTAIAHSIREQIQLFTKSLYITGHPFDGRPVEDADLQDGLLPTPLTNVFRPAFQAKDFTPYLYELNEGELEKTEKSLSREQRRQKRSVNRRGGPALPDLKDRLRTVRSLVVSSVLPGAAPTFEESRIIKRPEGVSRSGRRAATGGLRDGGDDESESDSSDESGPDSPALSLINNVGAAGTSRTRNMRGAASAAQIAMRATMGRSATPEASAIVDHHHSTRTSRRIGGVGGLGEREDSFDSGKLIVKLKIGRERFRQLMRDQKAKAAAAASAAAAAAASAAVAAAANASTTAATPGSTAGASTTTATPVPPPTAPKVTPVPPPVLSPLPGQSPSIARPSSSASAGTPHDRVDAPGPPGPNVPPPAIPAWIREAIAQSQKAYPSDLFEGFMRWGPYSISTNDPILPNSLDPTKPPPADVKYAYFPRIRCLDCPGKVYTPGPDKTLQNFDVHLKNRSHRDRVDRRLAGGSSQGS